VRREEEEEVAPKTNTPECKTLAPQALRLCSGNSIAQSSKVAFY